MSKPPPKKVPAPPPGAAGPAPPQQPAAKAPPGAKPPSDRVMVGGVKKVTLSKGGGKVGGGLLAQMKATSASAKGAASKAAAVSAEPMEDRVFALPGIEDPGECEVFTRFVADVLPKIPLPDTSLSILQAFANIDVTAEKVAGILKSNAYYEYHFMRVIESMGRRSELPSLDAAIILLGMQNSRNLIVALQALRRVKGGHPEWNKDGKLRLAPADVLKYALKTEELLAAHKDAHADMAYVAGLLFDMLALLAEDLSSDRKRAIAYIDHIYAHGIRTAQIGVELAKAIPDFAYSRYVFSACLVHDIGKCLLAILSPEYLPYLEEAGKKNLPRAVRQFAESQRFGIQHAMLGSLVCNSYQMLRPIERAVLFHHEPFHLRTGNKNLFQLCSIMCLSTNIANYYKRVEKSDDPILGYWRGPELKDFKIDTQALLGTVQRVGA